MVERRLGRGLEFFLSDRGTESPTAAPSADHSAEDVAQLELSQLVPSPFQPRTDFDPVELGKLAASLRSSGVLQPILVRRAGKQYQIIAGERRWRAAQMAGLERIPALIRQVEDEEAMVLALVENVQRTDLNAIEKAKAFKEIQRATKGSQTDVAKAVGLDRSTVTNMLRLLELPAEVQSHVSRGTITMGHARALLGLAGAEEQKTLAAEIIKKRMSVREVETLVQDLNTATEPPGPGKKKAAAAASSSSKGRPVWLDEIEETLSEALACSVTVRYGRKRSKITIECTGREEFERVYSLLKSITGSDEL